MRSASLWFAIYMVWLSAALPGLVIYAMSSWKGWREHGGGWRRLVFDVRRLAMFLMSRADFGRMYDPGQKLRFGITMTLFATSFIAAFYWQLDRTAWTLSQLAVNAFVVGISYAGIMVHLHVAWQENMWIWRALVWAQAILFVALNVVMPFLHMRNSL